MSGRPCQCRDLWDRVCWARRTCRSTPLVLRQRFRGVTVAVIDTSVDPAHPSFRLPGGSTKVVRSLASTGCVNVSLTDPSCVRDVDRSVDTDGLTGVPRDPPSPTWANTPSP